MFFRICDILGGFLIVLGLWNVTRNRKWWYCYCAGSLLFLIVVINKGLLGLTFMGIITLVTGLKNSRKRI